MVERGIFARIATSLLLICVFQGLAKAEPAAWAPFPVEVWESPFEDGSSRIDARYEPLESASEPWLICVLIPHVKDAYWIAVNYGLVEDAERLGIRVRLFEAGGYDNLDNQISQAEECLEKDVDGFVVSAVSFEGLTPTLEKIHAAGKPIVDLINGATFTDFSARAAVDYYDLAHMMGRYIVDKHADEDRDIGVIWFPGPELAGWSSRADVGFVDALEGTRVKIRKTGYGDTGKRVQGKLVKEAMDAVKSIDYIVGTTVTAEAAVGYVRKNRIQDETTVLSYYFGPGVNVGLQRGTIEAAITEQQAILGRIALDQLVRILEGRPLMTHVGTKPMLLNAETIRDFDSSTSLAPRGFTTRFNVN